MRRLAAPFVVAPPAGARIRTRLRLSAWDEAVVREVGASLGQLAGTTLPSAAESAAVPISVRSASTR